MRSRSVAVRSRGAKSPREDGPEDYVALKKLKLDSESKSSSLSTETSPRTAPMFRPALDGGPAIPYSRPGGVVQRAHYPEFRRTYPPMEDLSSQRAPLGNSHPTPLRGRGGGFGSAGVDARFESRGSFDFPDLMSPVPSYNSFFGDYRQRPHADLPPGAYAFPGPPMHHPGVTMMNSEFRNPNYDAGMSGMEPPPFAVPKEEPEYDSRSRSSSPMFTEKD